MVLRQEMGRYSVMREAPGYLGTKERIAAFVEAGRKEDLKKCWIDWITSEPRMSHADL